MSACKQHSNACILSEGLWLCNFAWADLLKEERNKTSLFKLVTTKAARKDSEEGITENINSAILENVSPPINKNIVRIKLTLEGADRNLRRSFYEARNHFNKSLSQCME
jgi:hypothetical protein